MRLIKINAPLGKSAEIAEIAFSNGINKISVYQIGILREDGKSETKEAIDIETSTPKAKRFVEALLGADFYDEKDFTINTRQPRSIISAESLRELTVPWVEPAFDILEELWQFSHITAGFVGRIFIAACLLAYGLIHAQTLTIIGGLLFLPLLPLLLAIGFGARSNHWKLSIQGASAFVTAIILLVLGGALVAALSAPPLKFDDFNSLSVSLLFSAAVGAAAGLAIADDAGRRELIGLAATAQVAVIPVWFGVCLVFGFPTTISTNEVITRGITFFLNVLTVIIVSLGTGILLGAWKSSNLRRARKS